MVTQGHWFWCKCSNYGGFMWPGQWVTCEREPITREWDGPQAGSKGKDPTQRVTDKVFDHASYRYLTGATKY